MTIIAITGDQPNRLECLADVTVRVPAVDTAITQELHMGERSIVGIKRSSRNKP